MGKKGKARRAQEKRKVKSQRKSAMKAQYASWASEGITKRTRRSRKRVKAGKKGISGGHIVANCGNLGCIRCNPSMNLAFYERMAAQRKEHRDLEKAQQAAYLIDPVRLKKERAQARKRRTWR